MSSSESFKAFFAVIAVALMVYGVYSNPAPLKRFFFLLFGYG